MEAGRIKELRPAVNAVADETLGPDDLMPRLRIDGDLTFRGITGGVAAGVASLAPFGAGNPRPVFAARGVEIIDGPRKLKERHLKMALKQDGRIFRAVAWRAPSATTILAEHKAALDVAFSLEQNQYNGETYVELTLADLKPRPLSSRLPQILTSSDPQTHDALAAARPPAHRGLRLDLRGLRRVSVQTPRSASETPPAAKIAPGVVVESTGCTLERFTLSRPDVSIKCARSVLMRTGRAPCSAWEIVTDERNGTRTFTVTAKEGHIGQKESTIALDGDVRLSASDGLTAKTEHATYTPRATGRSARRGRSNLRADGCMAPASA